MDICPKCGLPKEACVCEGIVKTEQKIKIDIVKKRYGKISTVITGIDPSIDMKQIAKTLKSELACGGTIKNNAIELQGEHRKKAQEVLQGLGFPAESV
ncbi:stress response translation initiation inhibitor YciH [Candidatus Pacearchaeota archaeon]|nr:stress response translation initiation inhibitor YciH [Candidatus Pacearchaeota archaeon]